MVGAPSEEISDSIVEELEERGLIRIGNTTKTFDGTLFLGVNLSLDGWEKYEEEKHGGFDGNYGFIAMKFGDDRLDAFLQDVVRPAVREQLGIDLVDLRDVAQAGVIDDIMRVKIRDAKFVIADLTHDNNGAYWEAGYAEGLGKPVIYICEKAEIRGIKNSLRCQSLHDGPVVGEQPRWGLRRANSGTPSVSESIAGHAREAPCRA